MSDSRRTIQDSKPTPTPPYTYDRVDVMGYGTVGARVNVADRELVYLQMTHEVESDDDGPDGSTVSRLTFLLLQSELAEVVALLTKYLR